MSVEYVIGDCREVLKTLPDNSINCCVTSPPYFGLRDYGHENQIGLERTPDEYVNELVKVFGEVRRVLRDDGTLFLNLGDSYYGSSQTCGTKSKEGSKKRQGRMFKKPLHDKHVQSCDISCKEELDSPYHDYSSENPYDGRINYQLNHKADIYHRHVHEQVLELCHQIQEYMEELISRLPTEDYSYLLQKKQSLISNLDQVRSLIPLIEQLLSFQESKHSLSSKQRQDYKKRKDMILAFLSSLRSLVAYVPQFLYKLDDVSKILYCTQDIFLLSSELADHIRCTYGYCLLVASWLEHPYIQPYSTTSNNIKVALKPKDLIGIPWRVAFALQADGWYLRQDIIWAKPNPMPESVKDRCTKSHEYIFLLSKSERYYFDAESISEPVTESTVKRLSQLTLEKQEGSYRVPGKTNGSMKAVQPSFKNLMEKGQQPRTMHLKRLEGEEYYSSTRNRRSVWNINTTPYKGAHFATFPKQLVEPCILAGCPVGGTVLDPFGGSGTVGEVCRLHQRNAILIELNPEYEPLIKERIGANIPELSTFEVVL